MPFPDDRPPPPAADWLRSFRIPTIFLIAAAGAVFIEIPITRFFKQVRCPGLIVELLDRAEPFGHFFGAAMVLTAVVLLDPVMRRRIGWGIGATLGGGLLANIVKLLVQRTRPRAFDLSDGTVWETFGGWIQKNLSSNNQSFPSGHTASAFGLAVILAAWYPRGRWLFITVAALVGMHRIQHLAHFPSDVCAGVAAGWFVAACCIRGDERRLASERLDAEPRTNGAPMNGDQPKPSRLMRDHEETTVV